MKLALKQKTVQFFESIPLKVLSIWVLAVEGVEFVIGVKLTVSFLRALARRFINWKDY